MPRYWQLFSMLKKIYIFIYKLKHAKELLHPGICQWLAATIILFYALLFSLQCQKLHLNKKSTFHEVAKKTHGCYFELFKVLFQKLSPVQIIHIRYSLILNYFIPLNARFLSSCCHDFQWKRKKNMNYLQRAKLIC